MNRCYSWATNGIPAPQGSKRHVGNGRMVESSKALKPWREQIIADAKQLQINDPLDTPVGVTLVFCFPRPKHHYSKNGTLKATAPKHKITRPDLDKLTRGVLDSLVLASLTALCLQALSRMTHSSTASPRTSGTAPQANSRAS